MSKPKIVFLSLHSIWAIAGISACLVLANATKGHPPGIIFLPVAVGIWVVGHVFLLISGLLLISGMKRAKEREVTNDKWPLTLVLVAFIFGSISVFGIFAVGLKILLDLLQGESMLSRLPIYQLLLGLSSSICFVGILLRQSWSRLFASGIFLTTGIFLAYQMIRFSSLPPRYHSTIGWLIAIVVLGLLLFLGQHLYRSSRIRDFYAK